MTSKTYPLSFLPYQHCVGTDSFFELHADTPVVVVSLRAALKDKIYAFATFNYRATKFPIFLLFFWSKVPYYYLFLLFGFDVPTFVPIFLLFYAATPEFMCVGWLSGQSIAPAKRRPGFISQPMMTCEFFPTVPYCCSFSCVIRVG